MIAQQVVPGNVLFVFDESLSMNETWSGGKSKWTVATQAVIAAITSLQDQINAATLFFPNAGFDVCGVSAIDSGSQINFLAGPKFVSAWNTYMASHGPNGFTPTGTAMQLADTALKNASLTGTTAVVVITDGDPNCGTNDSQVNQLAANWLTKGIKTHVFGLPGASAGTARLNALAASGGTGQFITPNDPAALQMSLAQIAGAAVSTGFDTCRITLPKQPPNPADVTLVVVQQGIKQSVARDLGTGGGWALDANGAGITLLGALCDQAKQGAYAKISVVFGCVDLPPLPPPAAELRGSTGAAGRAPRRTVVGRRAFAGAPTQSDAPLPLGYSERGSANGSGHAPPVLPASVATTISSSSGSTGLVTWD